MAATCASTCPTTAGAAAGFLPAEAAKFNAAAFAAGAGFPSTFGATGAFNNWSALNNGFPSSMNSLGNLWNGSFGGFNGVNGVNAGFPFAGFNGLNAAGFNGINAAGFNGINAAAGFPSVYGYGAGYPYSYSPYSYSAYNYGLPQTFGGYGAWNNQFGAGNNAFFNNNAFGGFPWGNELALLKSIDNNNGNLYTVGFRPSSAIEYYSLVNPVRYLDSNGSRMIWLCYDLKGYKPEEITVTLNKAERAVIVEAAHEIKDGKEHHVLRKFVRKFVLPESLSKVDLSKAEVKSCLNVDGLLSIEVLLPKATADEIRACPIMSKMHDMPYGFNGGLNNYLASRFFSYENSLKPVAVKTA